MPPAGGDTVFANMYRVFDGLTSAEKTMLENKTCVHTASLTAAQVRGDHLASGSMVNSDNSPENFRASHPISKTHPETGKTSVYVSPAHTETIEGFDSDESRELLESLYERATAESNLGRVCWRPGTLVIWDNRASLHCAINDYDGYRRHMQRVTIV